MRWLPFILIICAACSQQVISFFDEEADLKSYTSYIILNFKTTEGEISTEGKAFFDTLESSLHRKLQQYGFQPSTPPDILVRYELIANTETQTVTNPSPFAVPSVSTRIFRESALLVELKDRETKKLIWHASIDLKQQSKKSKKEDMLKDAMEQLFTTLPLPDQTTSKK